tara:strand:+ start:950 stop:1186 length:237 start_codon:yes stop_codon:yes gene_type:complete
MIEIFTGFILQMIASVGGTVMEFTPRKSLSECLKVKRKIERESDTYQGPRWVCMKGKLEMHKTMDGSYRPMKMLPYDG